MATAKPTTKPAPGKPKQTAVRQTFSSTLAFDARIQRCAKARGLRSAKIIFIAVEKYLTDNQF